MTVLLPWRLETCSVSLLDHQPPMVNTQTKARDALQS
jgi:hypothetical protein